MSGIDNELKNELNEKMVDCYEIAQSIPQNILDKNPIYKKFGRNMIFFKCQHVRRQFYLLNSVAAKLCRFEHSNFPRGL
jgi:hypothetical protein